jgi:type II secretion system protein G
MCSTAPTMPASRPPAPTSPTSAGPQTLQARQPALPEPEQGLQALVSRPGAGPQPPNWRATLDKLPKDPWGRPYQYLNPGLKGEVDVISLGADGQPGGEGKNADIGSWQ